MRVVEFDLIGGKSYECNSLHDESGEYVKVGDIEIIKDAVKLLKNILTYGCEYMEIDMEYKQGMKLVEKLENLVTREK